MNNQFNKWREILSRPGTKKKLIILLLIIVVGLFAYRLIKARQQTTADSELAPMPVTVSSVTDLKKAERTLDYPALVSAEHEAKIFARASGSLRGAFKVGDTVKLGQELGRIEEIGSPVASAGFNTSLIKQATIAAGQAKNSYDMARTNYDNALMSTASDLKQAEIARNQASTGKTNVDVNTAEAMKSAQLAYENAKLALDNARKKGGQSSSDTEENAQLSSDTAVNTANSMVTYVNSIAAFDENNMVNISYQMNLGAADSNQYERAKNSYKLARDAYNKYLALNITSINQKVDESIKVAELAKTMLVETKLMMSKTISSSNLPQATIGSFQTSLAANDSQMAGVLAQVKSARQGLANVNINNDTLIQSLEKSVELAQQNLNTLKAGNSSQIDQAGFGASAANNQYETTKIKLSSQLSVYKSQLDGAQLQYQTALVNLQGLYDSHQIIAPIDGTVTQIAVSDGETVGPGQLVATVSDTSKLMVRFYVEEEALSQIKAGMTVNIKDNQDKVYTGIVSAVAPSADAITKRYLVEVKPDANFLLPAGSIININLTLTEAVASSGNIIMPLSALAIGQNESYVYVVNGDKAKKVIVKVEKVIGERAEVSGTLTDQDQVIIEGAKSLNDGDKVSY